MALITINQLKNQYKSYLQAANGSINAQAPNSFWDIDAGAMAAILLDLYLNLQLVQNSIYPQYATGDQVDQWLYSRGLKARGGLTYGTINCVTTVPTTYPFTIPANTVFTDIGNTSPLIPASGNQYQTLQSWVIASGTTLITLYAVTVGNNILESTSALLQNTALGITIQVASSTNGQLEESDQSCITRILQSVRIPQAGSRTTDYFAFALAADPEVTDAIVIPGYYILNNISILGVFPLVGTSITEYQLNQGLLASTTFVPYSRQAGDDVITTVDTYIQNLRLVGLSVSVGTSITDIISAFTVTVSLVAGYSLATIINVTSQDVTGSPIVVSLTAAQLIQREVRRAICTQPFGATPIGALNYITIDSLITAVSNQLSSTGGQLAQILTNIQFSVTDISVPPFSASEDNLFYTYDVAAYSSITVALV